MKKYPSMIHEEVNPCVTDRSDNIFSFTKANPYFPPYEDLKAWTEDKDSLPACMLQHHRQVQV